MQRHRLGPLNRAQVGPVDVLGDHALEHATIRQRNLVQRHALVARVVGVALAQQSIRSHAGVTENQFVVVGQAGMRARLRWGLQADLPNALGKALHFGWIDTAQLMRIGVNNVERHMHELITRARVIGAGTHHKIFDAP